MSLFKSGISKNNPLGRISVKEYMQLYSEQPRELILRIMGSKGKYFMVKGRNCVYRVAFDYAIDPTSGELLSFPVDTYLNWVGSENLDPEDVPVFRLSEGCCCRVLVKQSIKISPSEDDGRFLNEFSKSEQFYLVELLDTVLHEPQLESLPLPEKKKDPPKPDPLTKLNQKFKEDITERSLFLKTEPFIREDGDYLLSNADYVTLAKKADGSQFRKNGSLNWIQRKQDAPAFQLTLATPYRVAVREPLNGSAQLLLVNILGETNDKDLIEIAKEYLAPVVLQDELGTFKLDRRFNSFESTVKLHSSFVRVSLDVEEGDTEARLQLAQLHELASEFPAFENRVKQYAAKELSTTAADWGNKLNMISKVFQKNLHITDLSIGLNYMAVFFDCGNMFAGHSIEVDLDGAGNCRDVKLLG